MFRLHLEEDGSIINLDDISYVRFFRHWGEKAKGLQAHILLSCGEWLELNGPDVEEIRNHLFTMALKKPGASLGKE